MARILVINPNRSADCSRGIEAAIAPFAFAGGPVLEVATLAGGPPAVYTWRDWHAAVEPLCRLIERDPADAYVVALARMRGGIVVTQETPAAEKRNPKRTHFIPDVCRELGISCISLLGLMRREGWTF